MASFAVDDAVADADTLRDVIRLSVLLSTTSQLAWLPRREKTAFKLNGGGVFGRVNGKQFLDATLGVELLKLLLGDGELVCGSGCVRFFVIFSCFILPVPVLLFQPKYRLGHPEI